ncbi:MAG: adenylate/guanylate cyclase domain-containing protein [Saprospiraceae bacterium]
MRKILLKHGHTLAAAIAIAGLCAWWLTRPQPPHPLGIEQTSPEKDRLAGILTDLQNFGFAGQGGAEDSLATALGQYGSGQYEQAQQSLETYLAAHPTDLTARFYLGMAVLYRDMPERAFGILAPLADLSTFEMQDDARWYAALAATRTDPARAAGLFGRISHDPQSKYREAAALVLGNLSQKAGAARFEVRRGGTAVQAALVLTTPPMWWQADWFRALMVVFCSATGMGMVVWRRRIVQLEREKGELTHEMARSEALLHNILPAETAEALKKYGHSDTRHYDIATVLFCDFKDFTTISERIPPEELVGYLNECFEAFDRIVTDEGLEKIKTVGDCYICAGGLSARNGHEAVEVVRTGQRMLEFLKTFNARQRAAARPVFEARIGIHTGPVVAGIVGIKKYAYDIWGDTVNIAARMEQSSEGGRINISGATHELVKAHFRCNHRGKVEAKGKGAVDMYFVEEAISL